MFIFLLFASDGCRNVCQVFSQRLGAQLRRHRRARGESRDADGRKNPQQTPPTHAHWRASLRTWIKCLCAGTCAFAPGVDSGGRECVEGGSAGARIQTLVKLLLQKLLHQAKLAAPNGPEAQITDKHSE
uniref:Uncharacterized protein n=2 Tax=Anopheles atroparvus TaxID=41427 RepID=A0A182IZX4_ANOAO